MLMPEVFSSALKKESPDMSRFLRPSLSRLAPYIPGEQPRDRGYIKLNTNESPFPPASGREPLRLYPDPEYVHLRESLGTYYGLDKDQVLPSNGSDEMLSFAFLAYGDASSPFVTTDIGYGLYPVLCGLYAIPLKTIFLREDFTVNAEAFCGIHKHIVLANPNAPTGLALKPETLAAIAASNPRHVLIVDEAYVDFGAESAVSLIPFHENLLVIRTFSKSRALAGARIGLALGQRELIEDLNRIRNSINPYNLSRMAQEEALLSLEKESYFQECRKEILLSRRYTSDALRALGFSVTDSQTNFIFAKSPRLSGKALYLALKEKGILVRHFKKERIGEYVRITIGSREEMERLIHAAEECIKEETAYEKGSH